jgi:hypothetical protein
MRNSASKCSLTSVKRHLGDFEEAVGRLESIDRSGTSLYFVMDTVQFVVDFDSEQKVESARQQLTPHLGNHIAVLLDTDTTRSLHVRPATFLDEPHGACK